MFVCVGFCCNNVYLTYLKFSAVLGVRSANNSNLILPTSWNRYNIGSYINVRTCRLSERMQVWRNENLKVLIISVKCLLFLDPYHIANWDIKENNWIIWASLSYLLHFLKIVKISILEKFFSRSKIFTPPTTTTN